MHPAVCITLCADSPMGLHYCVRRTLSRSYQDDGVEFDSSDKEELAMLDTCATPGDVEKAPHTRRSC